MTYGNNRLRSVISLEILENFTVLLHKHTIEGGFPKLLQAMSHMLRCPRGCRGAIALRLFSMFDQERDAGFLKISLNKYLLLRSLFIDTNGSQTIHFLFPFSVKKKKFECSPLILFIYLLCVYVSISILLNL